MKLGMKKVLEILDRIAKNTTLLFCVAVVSWGIRFSPDAVAKPLGLRPTPPSFHPWVAIAFAASCVFLASSIVSMCWRWTKHQVAMKRARKERNDSLKNLTPEEQHILRCFVRDGNKLVRLSSYIPYVSALAKKGIIDCTIPRMSQSKPYPYRLTEWARKELERNPGFLVDSD